MNGVPLLTVLWTVPLAGALLVLAMPARLQTAAKAVAIGTAVLVLAVAAVLGVRFDSGGAPYQFTESHEWMPTFGSGYTLGIDGVALALVLLTAALMPVLLLAGWNDASAPAGAASTSKDPQPPAAGNAVAEPATRSGAAGLSARGGQGLHGRPVHLYLALMLVAESMVLMSLISLDVLLFYVFFEAMLIPMYFLIGGFGGPGRSRAAVKFLLYNLFGGLVMLAAVIGLYAVTARTGPATFDFRTIVAAANSGGLGADPAILKALFLGFMFAFAVKAPLWPFHTWLPGAAVEATPASAVLMMAIMDKVGTFGMLRYCVQLFPDASRYFAPLIVTLAVGGILYGAVLAIGQTDMMRLIAYTSISHFGFIILGIFVLTSQGQAGSALYMVNHGLATAALFLVAGFLVSRTGTRMIAAYGGVQRVAPVLAGTFLIAGLATLSLPGLAPFISEFLVLIGTYARYPAAAIAATFALVLAAIYVLWLYQRVMTGPGADSNSKITDLRPRELVVLTPLLALVVVLGVYPKPLLDMVDPAIGHTLSTIKQTDPAPSHPPALRAPQSHPPAQQAPRPGTGEK